MDNLFKDKTVLISGGLGDIGRAIVTRFAQQGANIAIGDLLPESEAATFLKELQPYKGLYSYTTVDVTDDTAVNKWIIDTETTQGIISMVIANAAMVTLADVKSITAQQWSKELQVNLNGAFYVTQAATRRMVHHKIPGRVVFIGSWAAHAPHPGIPAYCVSKAGIRMLCRCMALELAPYQILVNEIAPGYVAAGLSARVWKQQPDAAEEARQKVPVKKVISPDEVAWQVVNLCHPENSQMTGSTIVMDGGLSLLS
ncbi:SDR family oxidoreductase [Pedobacter sp. BS3]|uniref:SDR family NAD(P)-dependent oxidoreductase n=1 Tax=Pedobacter sp. BS3 TaxID=2567937 RepID=UPI0011EE3D88|nr:SDR family oxidoreductase [Pedobacter sp. BS3]TZF84021.1 SDR family oxidoreductase [Pedobacter sp. BS3]